MNSLKNSKSSENPPLTRRGFSIASNERVFTAGKTGSGKSTLIMMLLATVKRLIVVDSKDGLQDWLLDDFNRSSVNKIKNHEPIRVRVVQNEDALTLLRAAYEAGDIIIYIDEVTALIPPQSKPDQVFIDIWQRGRSRGVGAWASTQRPSGIPLLFMSESEHFFVFRLNLENDRKRIAEFAGDEIREPVRDKYGFYYYNTDDGNIRYYSKLKIS